MTNPKPNWASSPWIGEGASANWSLWRAGIEWDAKVQHAGAAINDAPQPPQPPQDDDSIYDEAAHD